MTVLNSTPLAAEMSIQIVKKYYEALRQGIVTKMCPSTLKFLI
jgi:hypothetical protein